MASADEEYLCGVRCEEVLRPAKALQHYLRALSLQPDHAPSHNNIGVIRQQSGEWEAAAAAYQKAIQANPQFGLAWYNLGNCLREDNRLEHAIECYRRALTLLPSDDEIRLNLAAALKDLRRFEDALAVLDQVPSSSPHFAKAQLNRGMVRLVCGEFAEGWDDYQARLQLESSPHPIPARAWDGKPLGERSILVRSEQGIGDQVMFASCLSELLAGAGPSFVECDARLVPLFARSFPRATVLQGSADHSAPALAGCDVITDLGTLPRFLRRRIDDFPKTIGYLRAEPSLVAKWRTSLARGGSALKVGVSWHGGKDAETRRRRSIALEHWGPVFRIPGVHFVNIQYGWAAAQASQVQNRFAITLDDGSDCDALLNLDDFAAKLAALDLVLTVDNSTAHLAAALGKPVWTLLPHAADWRWMLDREDTPWYPTMRLLRCRAADQWSELLQRTARMLTGAAFSRDFQIRAA
jgi:hypothetical protein